MNPDKRKANDVNKLNIPNECPLAKLGRNSPVYQYNQPYGTGNKPYLLPSQFKQPGQYHARQCTKQTFHETDSSSATGDDNKLGPILYDDKWNNYKYVRGRESSWCGDKRDGYYNGYGNDNARPRGVHESSQDSSQEYCEPITDNMRQLSMAKSYYTNEYTSLGQLLQIPKQKVTYTDEYRPYSSWSYDDDDYAQYKHARDNTRAYEWRNETGGASYSEKSYAQPPSPGFDHGYHTLLSATSQAVTWTDCHEKRRYVTRNYFSYLSDLLVLKIFENLPALQLAVLAQTCRRFGNLAWHPYLWKTITLKGASIHGDKALKNILNKLLSMENVESVCPYVQKIMISEGTRLSDKSLLLIAKRCPQLTHLQLHGCVQLSNSAITRVVLNCQNMQHLDLTGCVKFTTFVGVDVFTRKLPIQYLDLTDCAQLDDNGLHVIISNCPQLVYLYLRRCVTLTDAGIKYIPMYCCGLRELSVSDCANLTDFGLYELAKLGVTLRYLSVAKCDRVSDPGLKVIVRRFYKLRYLNCRGCEAVSDDAIIALAKSCPRLRALDIGKCDVTDNGLRELTELCPNLKKLSLKQCELITDNGIQYIANYCRGLQLLNVQDCPITIEGYRAVKKFCKRCVIEHTNPGFF